MSKEAMKLARKALKDCHYYMINAGLPNQSLLNEAFTAYMELEAELAKPDFWEGYVPEPVKPAQQGPKIDIYRSFEQWKSGNVLEHGVPRTEHYSEAQLDLVEMGWNYGYDAGRAVEQALDKKAENARELGLDYEPSNVIEMAREAGPLISTPFDVWCERFAELVRADEREACAKVCESLWRIDGQLTADEFAAEIRARSNT
jgi:hypothetical protein